MLMKYFNFYLGDICFVFSRTNSNHSVCHCQPNFSLGLSTKVWNFKVEISFFVDFVLVYVGFLPFHDILIFVNGKLKHVFHTANFISIERVQYFPSWMNLRIQLQNLNRIKASALTLSHQSLTMVRDEY